MKKLILIFGLLLTMSVFSQQLGDTRTKAVLNESFEKNYQGSRGKTSPFYYAKDGWLIVDVNIVEPVPGIISIENNDYPQSTAKKSYWEKAFKMVRERAERNQVGKKTLNELSAYEDKVFSYFNGIKKDWNQLKITVDLSGFTSSTHKKDLLKITVKEVYVGTTDFLESEYLTMIKLYAPQDPKEVKKLEKLKGEAREFIEDFMKCYFKKDANCLISSMTDSLERNGEFAFLKSDKEDQMREMFGENKIEGIKNVKEYIAKYDLLFFTHEELMLFIKKPEKDFVPFNGTFYFVGMIEKGGSFEDFRNFNGEGFPLIFSVKKVNGSWKINGIIK